jgi:hypothetical protein
LKLGFQVRAGVRDVAKVEALLEMAAEIKSDGEDSMPWCSQPDFFDFAPLHKADWRSQSAIWKEIK